MDEDPEQFTYLPHKERQEIERMKNAWWNRIIDAIKLAPGHQPDAAGQSTSKEIK